MRHGLIVASSDLAREGRYPISASVVSGLAVVLDSIAILAVGLGLYFCLVRVNAESFGYYLAACCSIWITVVMLFHFSELYRFAAIIRPLRSLDKIVIAFVTAFLFLLAAAFAFKVTSTFSRTWLTLYALSAVVTTLGSRLIFAWVVLNLVRRGFFTRNMIVVGHETHAKVIIERLRQRLPELVAITGIFLDSPSVAEIGGVRVRGDLASVAAFVRSNRVDDVLVAMPWSAEAEVLDTVEKLRELPVDVYLGSDLVGLRLDFREPPDHLASMPIFAIFGRPMSGWAVAIKAVEDYTLAAVALVIAAIPMLAISLLIRIDGPGPIIFKQQRLGFNNRAFSIYKFRTMVDGQATTKTIQATPNDQRTTRVGRFLRRTSLDELPQLFNVLNGTMSLVGPRPHAIDHNEEYAQQVRGYFSRHRVKPGITGWAQVNGLRGQTDRPEKMEQRVRHDIFYAENWSLMFDIRILLRTIAVVISRQNAY